MNTVNHLAHSDNASFFKTVETMQEIFGEVVANVAPAFGMPMTIKNADDLAALKERLGLSE